MNVADFRRKFVWTVTLHEVSSDRAEALLLAALADDKAKELLDELYAFGSLLVNETISRTAQLDAKAIRLVIWAVAVLGFLLLAPSVTLPFGRTVAAGAVVWAAVLLATVATVHAALALRVCHWEMPSAADWFKAELFSDPMRLRAYHILALLETHRNSDRRNAVKGERLRRSQWVLSVATVLILVVVALRRL